MRQELWRFGTVDKTDYDEMAQEGKCRVNITDKYPGILTKPLQVLFPFAGKDKAYFMPQVGDRVAVLTDEHCDDGVVLGSVYSVQNKAPEKASAEKFTVLFEDATVIQYDKEEQTLLIDSAKAINVIAHGNINIRSNKGDVVIATDGGAVNVMTNGGQINFQAQGGGVTISTKGSNVTVASNQGQLRLRGAPIFLN